MGRPVRPLGLIEIYTFTTGFSNFQTDAPLKRNSHIRVQADNKFKDNTKDMCKRNMLKMKKKIFQFLSSI